jgi:type II secretory pathway predicted ATPase ExeA
MEACATGRNSIMYEDFYGLKTDPFRLTSDHRFSFSHASYSRARASVQYALLRAEGFVMITGGPGTGKTTLIHDLMADLPRNEFIVGYLASSQLGADDLLRMTAHAFGMESAAPKKAQILMRLMEFLAQQYRLGLHALLIIDDAQDLAPAAMEELRLLNNLQQGGQQLLQIVLLGQEELRLLLRRPEMEQVHQRLVAAWHLEPLSPEETVGYVRHRLETAGWTGDPVIEPGVLPIVHAFSKGIPRRINLICSRLLLHGFMEQSHSITQADAETVAHNLGDEELTHREDERDEPSSSPEEGLRAAAPVPVAPHASGEKARAAVGGMPKIDAATWSRVDQGLYRTDAPTPPRTPSNIEPLEELGGLVRKGRVEAKAAESEPDRPPQTAPRKPQGKAVPGASQRREQPTASPAGSGTARKEPIAKPQPQPEPQRPQGKPLAAQPEDDGPDEPIPRITASPEVHISAEREWDERAPDTLGVAPGLVASAEPRFSHFQRVILVLLLFSLATLGTLYALRPGPAASRNGGGATRGRDGSATAGRANAASGGRRCTPGCRIGRSPRAGCVGGRGRRGGTGVAGAGNRHATAAASGRNVADGERYRTPGRISLGDPRRDAPGNTGNGCRRRAPVGTGAARASHPSTNRARAGIAGDRYGRARRGDPPRGGRSIRSRDAIRAQPGGGAGDGGTGTPGARACTGAGTRSGARSGAHAGTSP